MIRVAWILLLALCAASGASAQIAPNLSYGGFLSFSGTDLPLVPLSGSALYFEDDTISFPAPATLQQTTPVGFTSSAPVNSIYQLRRSLSLDGYGPSAFTAGAGPQGGFGGVMPLLGSLRYELGIVPLPNVFGSLSVPLSWIGNVERTGVTRQTTVLGNAVTLVATAGRWTTGRVTVPTASGTLSASGFVTGGPTAAETQPTGSTGIWLNLVTPFSFRLQGPEGTLAEATGIARFELLGSWLGLPIPVPEPHTTLLLLAAALSAARGRSLHRTQ